jgi:hypothetical protein
MNPFHLLFTVGFAWVATLSFVEVWQKRQPRRRYQQSIRVSETPLSKRRSTIRKVKRA